VSSGFGAWTVASLAEAEAAHIAESKRIIQAKRAHEALAEEEANRAAKSARILKMRLHSMLHKASCGGGNNDTNISRDERHDGNREHDGGGTTTPPPQHAPKSLCDAIDGNYSHLLPLPLLSPTPVTFRAGYLGTSLPITGQAAPAHVATCLATTYFHATSSSASEIAAPTMEAPRPEEANHD
jgi:hypothetical protein